MLGTNSRKTNEKVKKLNTKGNVLCGSGEW